LKYRHLINECQKFTVSRSVCLRSMKLTLTSALTASRWEDCESRVTPDFLSTLQLPPNSPDLKPVDYAIWVSCRCASTARESVTSTTSLSSSCRNGPDLTTRHQCCSYLVASSFACVCGSRRRTLWFWTLFVTIHEWSHWHCFIGDNVQSMLSGKLVFDMICNKIWSLCQIFTNFCTKCTNKCEI